MLHIIYRSHGGENTKGRPDYYSKLLSLVSFIRSFQQLESGVADIIFLNDGPIPQDRLRIMEKSGEVLARVNLGLRGSMQTALAIPVLRAWSHNHLVWFSEDDYLYLPHALSNLIAAAQVHPYASYFGLYAMIGMRQPNGIPSTDRIPSQLQDSETAFVLDHPWNRALSTTSTFGARVKPLVEDRLMMQLAMKSGGAWDHTTCLMYQGFTPYPLSSLVDPLLNTVSKKSWPYRLGTLIARLGLNCYQTIRSLRRSNQRLFIAADPALITHLETSNLALGTDWRAVARSTQQWMDAGFKCIQ